jgi:hypothetical protein
MSESYAAAMATYRKSDGFKAKDWQTIPKTREIFIANLFWPTPIIKKPHEETDEGVCTCDKCSDFNDPQGLPFDDLWPLLRFRNLHILQLEGMTVSYQPIIWQVVWSNANLKILHLEMCLEPLFNVDTTRPNRLIDHKWSVIPAIDDSTSSTSSLVEISATSGSDETYLGDKGKGVLHESYGDGEYLDVRAITAARDAAFKNYTRARGNDHYLPIEQLTLANFVVDGLALERWFDPNKLKEVKFKFGCVDAGFVSQPFTLLFLFPWPYLPFVSCTNTWLYSTYPPRCPQRWTWPSLRPLPQQEPSRSCVQLGPYD